MQKILFRICICIACISLTALTADVIYASANKKQPLEPQSTFYSYVVKTGDSIDFELSQLQGKIVLVVNTATKCGFTPQYEGLQALYEKYHDLGLEILDFPCNQFMNQAPGSNAEITQFCQTTYNTTFAQMAKIEVNGKNQHPLYAYLKSALPNENQDIKWNFEKFLIDRQGKVVARYSTRTKPEEIEQQIESLLKQ